MNAITKDFAVVTCLFSPQVHERRLRNFERFRTALGEGLWLAKVLRADQAMTGASTFTSENGSNVLYIGGRSEHVLWQKERLLNLLIDRLPETVRYVAWVDADVLFLEWDWMQSAREMLDHTPVIQLFDSVVHLDQDDFPLEQHPGLVAMAAQIGAEAWAQRRGAAGFAWAARREVFRDLRLLDVMVLGGADTYMAVGFAGQRTSELWNLLPEGLRRAVDAWCDQAYKVTGGQVGFLPGTIEHLYHGPLKTRGYLPRYELLRRAQFDPAKDLRRDENGLLAWNSPKPAFHAAVADYFARRAEAENA